MTLEFIQNWRGNLKGQIKDVDAGIGEVYIVRGVARLVQAAKQATPQIVANKKKVVR